MALWTPSSGKVYLPPPKPVARVLNTDEYVQGTSVFYHAYSERLLTVGHPYFDVRDPTDNTVTVPKVSGNQFRSFRVLFPDPNKFALSDPKFYNPDSERLVWRLRGIEIGRGGPLGIGSTGHPLFNKLADTENPNKYFQSSTDDRQNVSLDPKQTQLFVVGCAPCMGEHWDTAKPCSDKPLNKGDCPPIQLVNSVIQDGDMCDIGFGAMNFRALQEDHSGAPLDIVHDTCKYPDFLKMSNDSYGDAMFFFGKREQVYARHYYTRSGKVGDPIPNAVAPSDYYIPAADNQSQKTLSPSVYFTTPSGSLASSDSQLFNRPFWLQRAQGSNNGVLWSNQAFVTVADNTHNTNFTVSVFAGDGEKATYRSDDYKHYLRHVEEYELAFIVQLCKVALTPDVLAHINAMNPSILEDWQLGFVPTPAAGLEDKYRFIQSLATRCPDQNPPPPREDPYGKYNFWVVDLTEKLSLDLDQYSLGRKFLYQTGFQRGVKRVAAAKPAPTKRPAKRRRKT
nr:MAG: L1 protein [Varecia variegata papillomavirus 2]